MECRQEPRNIRPLSKEGQQDIAATKLQGAFSDPNAARAELAKAAALQVPGAGLAEIVPGSRPTTGQLTGDLGALSLERELATKQPDLAKSNPFGTGLEQQNAARTTARAVSSLRARRKLSGTRFGNRWPRSRPAMTLRWRARRQTHRTRRRGSGQAQRRRMSGPISEPRCKGPGTPPRAKSASYGAGSRPGRDFGPPCRSYCDWSGQNRRRGSLDGQAMAGEEAAIFDTAAESSGGRAVLGHHGAAQLALPWVK